MLAFVIVVIYSGNDPKTVGYDYDLWDLLITLIAAVFGYSFLLRVGGADAFEILIASFLAGTSTVTTVTALASLLPISFLNAAAVAVDANLFAISGAFALVVAFLRTRRRMSSGFW